MPEINLVAVGLATLGAFLLGGFWYSPLLFAKPWMRLQGITPEKAQEMQKGATSAYAIAIVATLVTAIIMSILVKQLGITAPVRGAGLGVLLWVGFAGTTGLTNAMFSRRPIGLFIIDGLYQLVYFAAMGAVFAVWH